MTKKILTAIPLLIASSHAATLVTWDFTGLANPAHGSAAVSVPAGSTIAPSTHATAGESGYTVGDITSGSSLIYTSRIEWSPGNSVASGELNLQRWDLTGTSGSVGTTGSVGNDIPDSWFQFAITADAGYTLTIDTIELSAWRNGGGAPEFYKWDYSLDGGTTWTPFGSTYEETNAGDSIFRDSSFSDSVSGGDILLRFAPTGGSGNIHIDSIVVSGSVAIPEPSSTAVLGSLLMFSLLRRRR